MKKTIQNILFTIYLVIAVFITVTLLSYNEFGITEFGSFTLLTITDNAIEPDFYEGELVIVNKNDKILTGRKAFFYDSSEDKVEVKLATIEDAEKINENETTYTLEGDRKISGEYVIGPAYTADVIPVMGTLLNILQSKWGFLFIIVFPALILFINQFGIVFSGIKEAKKEEAEEAEKAKDTKEIKEKDEK